jgi:hypothetical protein
MPPLAPVPGVLRIQLKQSYQSDLDVLSRYYMAFSGASPTVAGLTAMATTLSTNWGTVWAGYAGVEVFLNEVIVTDLTSATSAQGLYTANVEGTRTGGPLAAATASMMNFTVARRYRGGKPRVYLPYGTATDLATASAWTSGFVTGMNSSWTTWITDTIAAAPSGTTISGQVNVSYFAGFTNVAYGSPTKYRRVPTPRVGGPLVDIVTGHALNTRPASQRRRNLHSV